MLVLAHMLLLLLVVKTVRLWVLLRKSVMRVQPQGLLLLLLLLLRWVLCACCALLCEHVGHAELLLLLLHPCHAVLTTQQPLALCGTLCFAQRALHVGAWGGAGGGGWEGRG